MSNFLKAWVIQQEYRVARFPRMIMGANTHLDPTLNSTTNVEWTDIRHPSGFRDWLWVVHKGTRNLGTHWIPTVRLVMHPAGALKITLQRWNRENPPTSVFSMYTSYDDWEKGRKLELPTRDPRTEFTDEQWAAWRLPPRNESLVMDWEAQQILEGVREIPHDNPEDDHISSNRYRKMRKPVPPRKQPDSPLTLSNDSATDPETYRHDDNNARLFAFVDLYNGNDDESSSSSSSDSEQE